MLKKLKKFVRQALPGDTEKFLGTAVGLATGNPALGAAAGYLGSDVSGALTGGLSGYVSPGISGLQVNKFNKIFGDKPDVGNLFSKSVGGIDELFRGDDGKISKAKALLAGLSGAGILGALTKPEESKSLTAPQEVITLDTLSDAGSNLAFTKPNLIYPDAPEKQYDFDFGYGSVPVYANTGGIMGTRQLPRPNGIREIEGPGTATSDSIPAMLSDGEFVMNAKAVRGLGYKAGASDDYEARKLGAKKMYEAMDNLEAVA